MSAAPEYRTDHQTTPARRSQPSPTPNSPHHSKPERQGDVRGQARGSKKGSNPGGREDTEGLIGRRGLGLGQTHNVIAGLGQAAEHCRSAGGLEVLGGGFGVPRLVPAADHNGQLGMSSLDSPDQVSSGGQAVRRQVRDQDKIGRLRLDPFDHLQRGVDLLGDRHRDLRRCHQVPEQLEGEDVSGVIGRQGEDFRQREGRRLGRPVPGKFGLGRRRFAGQGERGEVDFGLTFEVFQDIGGDSDE